MIKQPSKPRSFQQSTLSSVLFSFAKWYSNWLHSAKLISCQGGIFLIFLLWLCDTPGLCGQDAHPPDQRPHGGGRGVRAGETDQN